MRIRKTLKLLNLSAYPPDAVIQETPHICKLNQSPWDLLHFSSSSSSPPSIFSPKQQIQHEQHGDGEINRYVDLSIGGSVEAYESEELMKEKPVSKEDDIALNSPMDLDICMNGKNNVAGDYNYESEGIKMHELSKNDASIQDHCKRKKSEKHTQSSNNVVKRRGRGPGKKTSASTSTSNPYEYYYYSGFGPLWGKKRGGEDRNDRESKREKNNIDDNDEMSEIEIDKIIDENEEDEDEEDNGKKRGRKPMKARSLKSLM